MGVPVSSLASVSSFQEAPSETGKGKQHNEEWVVAHLGFGLNRSSCFPDSGHYNAF